MNNETDLSYLPPNSTMAEGGMTSLWENVATVSCQVQNSGNYTAAEVPQLYIGIPGGPEKVLRGFGKEVLSPGSSCTFNFEINRRDLSYVDWRWMGFAKGYLQCVYW
jgi:beta-glucosidase